MFEMLINTIVCYLLERILDTIFDKIFETMPVWYPIIIDFIRSFLN